ncbi:MAG: hypothetical protein HYX75_17280 [Acidobacteria bacterium]|nr:hypothetical protein [Acidobacteriota bacterium]
MRECARSRTMTWCMVAAAAVLFGWSERASGQSFEMGTGLLFGLPVGEFHDQLDSRGIGFSFRVGKKIRRSPVSAGMDLSYLLYGSEKWGEPLLNDVPDVAVNVHTTNNILLLHLYVRVEPRHGRIRPFGEGVVGGSYLFTNTGLENPSTGESFASSINLSDWTSSYGIGGGIRYYLLDGMSAGRARVPFQVVLEARLTYLRGSSAKYLKKGSITRDQGEVFYDVQAARRGRRQPGCGIAHVVWVC